MAKEAGSHIAQFASCVEMGRAVEVVLLWEYRLRLRTRASMVSRCWPRLCVCLWLCAMCGLCAVVLLRYLSLYATAQTYPTCKCHNPDIGPLCIGSATNPGGACTRIKEYKKGQNIPARVKTLVDDGYEVVHGGVLFLTNIRDNVWNQRGRRSWTLFLETEFTYTFWTLESSLPTTWVLVSLCPWAIRDADRVRLYQCCPSLH